ncbi:MAG: PAS domain-containing protein, partial [Pseudomonadota bacterium]|nr:PAS domain-containing protein [Pseudomonadota bacterium]
MSRPFGPLAKTRLVQLYVLQGGRLIVEAANSGARGALGYRGRELEGLPFADLCPAAAHGVVRDALKTLRKTGDGVRQFELQLRHRDGTLRPTRARIRRLKSEPRRLLVECLDLTAQQRDQAGLVRASTLLQTVERETATGGWRLSPAGDRLELTETAAKLFSVPRRSVPLGEFLHVFDTSTRRKLSEALQVCGTGGTPFGLAAVTRDASDRIGWVSGRHVRHAGGGHEVVGTLASH